jgi:hypothetical protein
MRRGTTMSSISREEQDEKKQYEINFMFEEEEHIEKSRVR